MGSMIQCGGFRGGGGRSSTFFLLPGAEYGSLLEVMEGSSYPCPRNARESMPATVGTHMRLAVAAVTRHFATRLLVDSREGVCRL